MAVTANPSNWTEDGTVTLSGSIFSNRTLTVLMDGQGNGTPTVGDDVNQLYSDPDRPNTWIATTLTADTIDLGKFQLIMTVNDGFNDNMTFTGATALRNQLTTTSGQDTLTGGGQDDTLSAGSNNDMLTGGNGNDTLNGGSGVDTLNGDAGNDILIGGTGNDIINGGTNNDTINYTVGDGADTIDGGANTDTLAINGLSTNDTLAVLVSGGVITGIGGGTVTAVEQFTVALNSGTGDTLDYTATTEAVIVNLTNLTATGFTSVSGVENVTGGSGNDTLTGDTNANTLSGGGGADTFVYNAIGEIVSGETVDGGTGTDTLRVAGTGFFEFGSVAISSIEAITFTNSPSFAQANFDAGQFGGTGISNSVAITGNASNGFIQVQMSAPGTFSAAGWVLTSFDTSDRVNLIGSSGADTITGSSKINQITGGDGADHLIGGSGSSLFLVDSNDIVAGEIIEGNADGDVVNLTSSNATTDLSPATLINIVQLSLNNRTNITAIVSGNQIGAGAITTVASTPGDRVQSLIVNASSDVNLSAVTFTGWDSLNKTITINGTAAGETLTGSNQIDIINGGGGNDTLIGGLGADTINGDAGIDTASYATSTAGVVVGLGSHYTDGGHAAGDTLTSIENLIGSAFGDILEGDGGANVLTGGAGGDTLRGLAGDDTASYSGSAAGVVIGLGSNYTSGGDAAGDSLAGIENLIGSASSDILEGDGVANVLTGGAGGDQLVGKGGLDTASYATSTAGVVVGLGSNYTDGGHAAGDTLTSIENLTGSAFGDILEGDGGANVLDGGAGADTLRGLDGDDTLIGGVGADTLIGGNGLDTASYASSTAGVVVGLGSNYTDGGHAAGDSLVEIENLTGSGFGDILEGDGGANVLDGGAGNDTLRGLDGDDTLIGGVGGDTLIGGNGLDTAKYATSTAGVVIGLGSNYTDGGHAAGDSLAGIENLTGSAFGDILEGDGVNNVLTGGAGNDTLQGLDGDDLLVGGLGADLLVGGLGVDTLDYSASQAAIIIDLATNYATGGDATGDYQTGMENVIGSAFADTLYGDTANNWLDGKDGDDTLRGGLGVDVLAGGNGNDTFVFNPGAAIGDLLTDFNGNGAATGDQIRFVGFGAGAALNQLDATHWSIDYNGGTSHETLTFLNAASIHANDLIFV